MGRFIFILISLFVYYFFILNSPSKYSDQSIYLSNALLFCYSLWRLCSDKKMPYSVQKMFYLFILFFMTIAPLLQYKDGVQTVGGYRIYAETYFYLNVILLLCLFVYDIVYVKYLTTKDVDIQKFSILKKEQKVESDRWYRSLLILSLINILITCYIFRDNYLLLFFRGFESADKSDLIGNQILRAFYGAVIRPFPVICCFYYLLLGKKRERKLLFITLSLFSNFPLSLARLYAAAFYIPMILILFPYFRKGFRFVYLFVIGLLVAFPFLNQFRSFSLDKRIGLGFDFEMFTSINFDSYQSFAWVFQNGEITNGRQLMCVLFFWIPRSLWPDKPYMSGRMIAEKYNLWFEQISMNYFGEGYLNFGIVGVLLFTVLLAYVSARFDKLYWMTNVGYIYNSFSVFYLLFIGMFFFIMRGDLMNAFSYTISLFFGAYIVYRLTKKFY